jgi:hypothetical protein
VGFYYLFIFYFCAAPVFNLMGEVEKKKEKEKEIEKTLTLT